MQHLKLAFENSQNSIPNEIQKLFNFCSYDHTASLALKSVRSNCLEIPWVKSVNFGNKSVRYHCVTLWNHFVTKGIKLDSKTSLNMKKYTTSTNSKGN